MEPSEPEQGEPRDAERVVPRVPGDVQAFSPKASSGTQPVRPGLTGGSDWAELIDSRPPPRDDRIRPERTFINQIRGTVHVGPNGMRLFAPTDKEEAQRLPGALLLLPCVTLERFDEFVIRDAGSAPVLISGQLFLYNGRNYLLPGRIGPAWEETPEAESEDTNPAVGGTGAAAEAAQTTNDPADGLTGDKEIDSLIGELERRPVYRRMPSNRGRGETSDRGAQAEGETASTETYISQRRGRVVRETDGTWSFIPDSDDPEAGAVSMTLLPCRLLEAIERLTLTQGDRATFLLSGRVLLYHGTHYLLPTLFQREQRVGVDPLQ